MHTIKNPFCLIPHLYDLLISQPVTDHGPTKGAVSGTPLTPVMSIDSTNNSAVPVYKQWADHKKLQTDTQAELYPANQRFTDSETVITNIASTDLI